MVQVEGGRHSCNAFFLSAADQLVHPRDPADNVPHRVSHADTELDAVPLSDTFGHWHAHSHWHALSDVDADSEPVALSHRHAHRYRHAVVNSYADSERQPQRRPNAVCVCFELAGALPRSERFAVVYWRAHAVAELKPSCLAFTDCIADLDSVSFSRTVVIVTDGVSHAGS